MTENYREHWTAEDWQRLNRQINDERLRIRHESELYAQWIKRMAQRRRELKVAQRAAS